MSWGIFVWTVLPTGASLVAMLASGRTFIMWPARLVLSTPVKMGSLQLSLGSVVTTICLLMSTISWAGLRRAEHRASEASGLGMIYDQYMRDVFHHGRNLYLCLLGLTLWAIAWRLKVLYANKQLGPTQPRRHKAAGHRWLWTVPGVLALLAADVPLCRINYSMQLSNTVTPRKLTLQAKADPCKGVVESAAEGQCVEFCQKVRELSGERLASIKFARNWHVMGRLAAEVFDDARGVEQGQARIDTLFANKPCVDVLKSVDKSNFGVNVFCMVLAITAVIGAFTAFALIAGESDIQDQHED